MGIGTLRRYHDEGQKPEIAQDRQPEVVQNNHYNVISVADEKKQEKQEKKVKR